jgi:demethylmenaquinone methyltransferase/2-methoxy-6-polyprenyl-1,4-benzoquinol methylase
MITPDKSSKKSKKIQVKDMFNNISSKYDRINQVMTLNMDQNWRQTVYNLSMQDNPKKIIDIATGTGDIALCFANDDVEVIGIDNARQMLDIANQKKSSFKNIQFQLEDAENMSFENNSFDVATVGFGVRNFEDLNKGLNEIKRILKPGKKLIILETAVPSFFLLRLGYLFYTKMVVPFLGKIIAGNQQAYNYLSNSAEQFPHGKDFKEILEMNGFTDVTIIKLNLGIVNIYEATK